MSGYGDVLIKGLRRSLNLPLWLPLYGISLLFGLVQTWPLLANAGLLTRPQLGSIAAGGVDTWVNLLLTSPEAQTQASTTLSVWVLLSLLLGALYSLAYNFFVGGILSVWAGTRSFWAGCRYTFWSFTGLGLLLLLLAGPIVLIMMIAASFLGSGALVGGIGLILLVNLLGEYARSIAVAQSERNPFKLLGGTFMFGLRHSGGVLSLGLLGTALHFGLVFLYLAWGPLVSGTVALTLLQQGIILLWLWDKLLRLAWALSYVQIEEKGRNADWQL